MAILKRKGRPKVDQHEMLDINLISNADQLLRVAKSNGLETSPLDIESLIRLCGVGLRKYPMDNERSGYLRLDEGRWVIGVNSLHHPKRQRFTMAHELGHYFLHRNQSNNIEDTVLFRDSSFGGGGIEYEANEFAADLLMPEEEFSRLVVERKGVVADISEAFQVSSLAVTVRAKQLGYKEKT